jgi:DNA (cytosine-5)-methyltransferase 1
MTYLEALDSAWRDHLAPRAEDAPTVISLFAGCGGSSLGYGMAGYRELLAVEWDANAVETFRLNFPDVPVYHGDIAALDVEKCLSLAGIAPGELDVLDGSPPCQGFSTAGKREMGDDRNQLFHEFRRPGGDGLHIRPDRPREGPRMGHGLRARGRIKFD